MKAAYFVVMCGAVFISTLLSPYVRADLISFRDGTIASAEEVNANFRFLMGELAAVTEADSHDDLELSVDCNLNPAALQEAIDTARARSVRKVITASGTCSQIVIEGQIVEIRPGAVALTIQNNQGPEASAITVSDSGGLFMSGLIEVNGNAGTAISIAGQSYFIGAYTQIIGGRTGLAASWSNFLLVGNFGIQNTAQALSLGSSQGFLLGKLGDRKFNCNAQPDGPPACLNIGNGDSSGATSSAFSLINSRLGLGSENTQVTIVAGEADAEENSTISFGSGFVAIADFRVDTNSSTSAATPTAKALIFKGNVTYRNNSSGVFDYDSSDFQSGSLIIDGDIDIALGGMLSLESTVLSGEANISVSGKLFVGSSRALASGVKLHQGATVSSGELIVDLATVEILSSDDVLQSILGSRLLLVNSSADMRTYYAGLPSDDSLWTKFECRIDGKLYFLPENWRQLSRVGYPFAPDDLFGNIQNLTSQCL